MKRVLIAPNSFKECADSREVAEILEEAFVNFEQIRTMKLPVSDGGDGFLEVCRSLFDLNILNYSVTAPYDGGEKIQVKAGYSKDEKIIFIESAEVIGLKRIPIEQRHPLVLNSKGLGELVKQIKECKLNVEKLVIGVGGTGTSDMGLGFCSEFGLELYDFLNNKVEIIPANYFSVKNYKWKSIKLPFKINLIVDVDNPLLGEHGTIRTFAPQKGATIGELTVLEAGFNKIINLLINNNLLNPTEVLNGSGGGLAAGLKIFFNAEIVKAKDFIQNFLLPKADDFAPDFVVTGEGSFDRQSLMNKGAKVVTEYFSSKKIPIFLVCGKIDKETVKKLEGNVIPIELSNFFNDEAESIKNYEKGFILAAEQIKNYITAIEF